MKNFFTFLGVAAALCCAPAFAAPAASPEEICKSVLPAKTPAVVIEHCAYNFESFKQEQHLMAMGELARRTLKADQGLSGKILALAVQTAKKAETENRMYAYNKAESVNLNALNYGTGGAIQCVQAIDYTNDDEVGEVVPGLYSCQIRMNTRIIYLTNSCGETSDTLWDQAHEELTIEFKMKEDGTIDGTSLSTKAFEIVRSCAG